MFGGAASFHAKPTGHQNSHQTKKGHHERQPLISGNLLQLFQYELVIGGEGGIRTPDTRKGMPDFESGAFNRALPPLRFVYNSLLTVPDTLGLISGRFDGP